LSLDAWELHQRGLSLFFQFARDANAAARELFMRALALEPTYARACAKLAMTHHADLYFEYAPDRDASVARLLEAARRSVALDALDSSTHTVSSLAALWISDHDLAISEAQEAVKLNPSGIDENIVLGVALDMAGRSPEAVVFFQHAFRLSPRNPAMEVYLSMLARTQVNAGQFGAAAESAKRVMRGLPHLFEAHLVLASALANLGRDLEAAAAYRKAREVRPSGVALPPSWGRYKDAAASRNLLDGLRKAGWDG
jgi:adenylate cyclase